MNNKSGSTAAACCCLRTIHQLAALSYNFLTELSQKVQFLHSSVLACPHAVTSTEERKFTNRIEAAARHLAKKKT